MPTPTTPAIRAVASTGGSASAAPPVAASAGGNPSAQNVAACFGTGCSDHGHCQRYAGVEAPGQERFMSTCRTPEGMFPLFKDKRPPVPLPVVDGDGSEVD
jgi:hypothetical protein